MSHKQAKRARQEIRASQQLQNSDSINSVHFDVDEAVKRAVNPQLSPLKSAPEPLQILTGGMLKTQPIAGSLEQTLHSGRIVENWRSGWKWISNWSLAGIAYVTAFGVPPELIHALPTATQAKVTLVLAVVGFVGRFINQSRKADGVKDAT